MGKKRKSQDGQGTMNDTQPLLAAGEMTAQFSDTEIATTTAVLERLSDNPALKGFARSSESFKAMLAAGYRAFAPAPEEKKAAAKRAKKTQREADHGALDEVGIRKMRQVKMVGMIGGSVDLPKPPRIGTSAENEKFIEDDEAKVAREIAAEARKIQEKAQVILEQSDPVFTHVEAETQEEAQQKLPPPKKLNFKRSCHICGTLFDELHAFYDQLCADCSTLNYAKRFSKADMNGRVCLVTGARVKIGYAIALKFLRMNATKVIVTTRFPHDAARRFSLEPDVEFFKSRLTIYGLDFRDIRMMHHFCAHIRTKETRLDVIINNAAQTVRKPPGFYEHLISGEAIGSLDPDTLNSVEVVDVFRVGDKYLFGSPDITAAEAKRLTMNIKRGGSSEKPGLLHVVEKEGEIFLATPAQNATNLGTDFIPADAGSSAVVTLKDVVPVSEAASMSQIPLMVSDVTAAAQATQLFPKGLYDRDDQQVDLRTQNSWNLEMGQISTIEMMECHTINTFAPWILISELKSLMEASGPLDGTVLPEGIFFDKYIVNVSAMEGQFYRNKTIFHPHTNMAKASLNMMTRTASAGFAAIGIFMTAVDTGWITDEQPQHLWEKRSLQPPPLDEWDAAMRVIDPVLCGIRGEERVWGVFLKNYRPTR
ncbi:hypothetical protein HK100_006635, partial [Physocladia obscura]